MSLARGIRIVDRFEIVAPIGAGSMGEVYQAHDLKLGRDVAVKLLSPALAASHEHLLRFEREARAASLAEPSAHLHDLRRWPGARGGRTAPTSSWSCCAGTTLFEVMASGPMSLGTVVGLGVQIADALEVAHAAGIMHRDLKPANIFVTARGDAKLLDFGLAAMIESPEDTGNAASGATSGPLTSFGTAVGTVLYMSPEQALGDPLDARTDIFSFGVVLYEMLTARRAFEGRSTTAIVDAILHAAPAGLGAEAAARIPPTMRQPAAADDGERPRPPAVERRRSGWLPARGAERIDRRPRVRGHRSAERPRLERPRHRLGGISQAARGGSGRGPGRTIDLGCGAALEPPRDPRGRRRPRRAGGRLRRLLVVSQPPPALASSEPLLLADFRNTTGEAVFDGALKDALEIQLRQSPYLNLVPASQVRSTLQLMERSPNEPLSLAVARDVCERLGVKAVMHGSIAPLASAYVITLEALACRTGDTLVREQTQAASKTEVLASVTAAAARIREGLGESIASIQRFNVPAHNATTVSLEALKAYSMGVDTRLKTGDVQAIPYFQHALELDPNFALAAARLGAIYTNLRDLTQAQEYTKRAFARSDSLSEPERLFIKSHYHYIVTGRLDDAVATYRLWISTYPDDWVPHSNLSTTYVRLNRLEEAVAEARIAVKLAGTSVVAYQQLTRALLALGDLPEAKAATREAIQKGLDSSVIHMLAYQLAFIDKDAAGDAGAPPRGRVSRRQLRRADRSGARGVFLRRHRREPGCLRAGDHRRTDGAGPRHRPEPDCGAGARQCARRRHRTGTPAVAGSRGRARRRRRRDDVDGVAGGGIPGPDAAGRSAGPGLSRAGAARIRHRRRAAGDAAGRDRPLRQGRAPRARRS